MQSTEGGVTLANADCAFLRLGESSTNKLDTTTSRIAVLAGGQLDGSNLGIPRQDGDRRFRHRFALRSHGDEYDTAEAMRWSVQWQNPLVARRLDAATDVAAVAGSLPSSEFSLLSLQEPAAPSIGAGVLVWAVKPAEEGIGSGLIVRAWNVSEQCRTARLRFTRLRSAHAVSHIETNLEPLAVFDQQVTCDFRPHQIRTVRLLP